MLNIKGSIALSLSFLVILLHASSSYAQSSVWQASKDGRTLYIVGSMSLIPTPDFQLPQEFISVLQRTKNIYIQANLGNIKDPNVLMAKIYIGKSATNFKSSESLKIQLDQYCRRYKVACGDLNELPNPAWTAYYLLISGLESIGFRLDYNIQTYVQVRAKKNNKPVLFLENYVEKFKIFDQLNALGTELLSKYTLEYVNTVALNKNKLMHAWCTGNPQQLSLFNETISKYPKIYDIWLSQRNMSWMKKISAIVQQHKRSLIVVNIEHLTGKNNLFELLQRQGFSINHYVTKNSNTKSSDSSIKKLCAFPN